MYRSALLLLTVCALFQIGAAEESKSRAEIEHSGYTLYESTQVFQHGDAKITVYNAFEKGTSKEHVPPVIKSTLTVEDKDQESHRFQFPAIEPVGSAFGIFVPEKQPLAKYFIVVKNGDYDGRTYLISKKGKVFDFPGGYYFVSSDGQYLISQNASDASGFVAFDLKRNKLVLDAVEPPYYIQDWYESPEGIFSRKAQHRAAKQGREVSAS